MELREYRKRVSLNGTNRSTSLNNGLPPYLAGKGLGGGLNNPNDVNFSFEFPRFGRLPGPPVTNGSSSTLLNGARQSASPTAVTQQSPVERGQISPRNQSLQSLSSTNGSNAGLNGMAGLNQPSTQLDEGDMSSLSGLFSPSILNSVGKSSPFEFFATNGTNGTNGSRSSTDSNGQMSTGHNTSYSSPSASSNGNQGPSSSCGTSPEPSMQSPSYKPVEVTLSTIGEERTAGSEGELTFCEKLNMACGNPNNPVPKTMSETTSGNTETPAFDVNGIDWFAQQNGNQFDPQLFGDYREPQDNILSGGEFSDSFFTDAFAMPDFNSPFNVAPSPVPPKKDLVAQIDDKQNEDEEVVPGEDSSKLLTCNTIWYDPLDGCHHHYLFMFTEHKLIIYSGIVYRLARRLKKASSISTFCARISRRKPSALRLVPW